MILIIDNYDSFVFNLARYVAELGFAYQVVRNDHITLAQVQALSPTHIIVSPGPCTPNEAGISLALIEAYLDKLPILGVCLGHQAIAQACGGTVIRAKEPLHGKAESILHDGSGIFTGLPNPLKVARYHSLIVESVSLPQCLRVSAWSGKKEIMAFSHQQFPVFGVQFHPESVLTEQGHALLRNFISQVA